MPLLMGFPIPSHIATSFKLSYFYYETFIGKAKEGRQTLRLHDIEKTPDEQKILACSSLKAFLGTVSLTMTCSRWWWETLLQNVQLCAAAVGFWINLCMFKKILEEALEIGGKCCSSKTRIRSGQNLEVWQFPSERVERPNHGCGGM